MLTLFTIIVAQCVHMGTVRFAADGLAVKLRVIRTVRVALLRLQLAALLPAAAVLSPVAAAAKPAPEQIAVLILRVVILNVVRSTAVGAVGAPGALVLFLAEVAPRHKPGLVPLRLHLAVVRLVREYQPNLKLATPRLVRRPVPRPAVLGVLVL
jgi:hypothetical protein